MIYIFAINWQFFRLLHCKKGKYMLKKYIALVLFVTLVLFSSDIFSQQRGAPPCGSPPCGPPPPPDAPIDSGIGILLVLGVGYAVKKLKK